MGGLGASAMSSAGVYRAKQWKSYKILQGKAADGLGFRV